MLQMFHHQLWCWNESAFFASMQTCFVIFTIKIRQKQFFFFQCPWNLSERITVNLLVGHFANQSSYYSQRLAPTVFKNSLQTTQRYATASTNEIGCVEQPLHFKCQYPGEHRLIRVASFEVMCLELWQFWLTLYVFNFLPILHFFAKSLGPLFTHVTVKVYY